MSNSLSLENIAKSLDSDLEWEIVCEKWKRKDYSHFIPECGFPNQERAFEILLQDKPVELLYGGAGGGGKSYFGWIFFMMECATKPGLEVLIGRKEITNLIDNLSVTVAQVERKFDIPSGIYSYPTKMSHEYKFKNGSRIRLASTQSKPSDAKKDAYGSAILSYVWLEEGQETPVLAYDVLAHTRLGRQTDLNDIYGFHLSKLLITANPDKGWLYSEFYQPFKDGTLPDNKYFIHALAIDNPFGADYIKYNLQNISDPILRARLLDGNWDYEENQFQLFNHSDVMATLTRNQYNLGEIFITCDPARQGRDLAIIWVWSGYTAIELHIAPKSYTGEIIDRIKSLEAKYGSKRSNTIIDTDGVGGGVADGLFGCTEFYNKASAIDVNKEFNSVTTGLKKEQLFPSLKTQTYYAFSQCVKEGIVTVQTDIAIEFFGTVYPDTAEKYSDTQIRKMIQQELESILQTSRPEDKKYKISTKAEIKMKLGRSNDLTDSMMFRFVAEVTKQIHSEDEYDASVVEVIYTREEDMFNKMMAAM